VPKWARFMPRRLIGRWRHSVVILDHRTRWWWAVSFVPWKLYPSRKEHTIRISLEPGWAPEQVRVLRNGEKSRVPIGNRIPAVQSVARRSTDWAIPSIMKTVAINCENHKKHICELKHVATLCSQGLKLLITLSKSIAFNLHYANVVFTSNVCR
jgi:hypothetical protein